MKKILFFSCLLCTFMMNSQNDTTHNKCGTGTLPQQFETWVQSLTPTVKNGKNNVATIQSIVNIPVIVHVIHNNQNVNSNFATTGNNISAAQIIDQINILNKDFNGTNADSNLIPAVFKPLRGRFQVNFCLAVVNPTGGILAEPGIDRINRVSKGWTNLPYSTTYFDATVKPNSIWNPNKYFNIWLSTLTGGVLGYATFPNPSSSGVGGLPAPYGSATTDGIVVNPNNFGSIGTAQFSNNDKGRVATHEVGHWLGLRHIWGDSNCGTDFCNDTPPAQNSNYGCFNHPYKLGVCPGNTTGEMTMNFMDYGDDACMVMFTADQKNRAQLILTNSPIRAALITSTVCNLPTIGNDVGISFVSKPTYSQSINCNTNFINPVINVTNYGSVNLTSALFSYNIDGVNTQTLNWTGNVAPNTSFTVGIPQLSNISVGSHVFSVNVSQPNGGADNNLNNNNNTQQFSIISNFNFSSPSATTCAGTSTILTATGATTYSWSTGATTASVSLNPLVTTVYTVTGIIGSCSKPQTVTLTVQQLPTISVSNTNICANVPNTITASGASSYLWDTGETTSTISVELVSSTNYSVTGFTTAGCSITKNVNVVVNPLPTSSITVYYLTCDFCNDGMLSVAAVGGTEPYTYKWMPGNKNTTFISELETGCYNVTITDAKGCKTLDSACVSFDTAIRDLFKNDIDVNIFPNPSTGEFIIERSGTESAQLEITDALGRIIKQERLSETSIQLNLTAEPRGMYFLKISTDKGEKRLKLLKE